MKKVIVIVILIIIIVMILSFVFFGIMHELNSDVPIEDNNENIETEEVKEPSEEEKLALIVEGTLNSMTLREKIGQMLIISYNGTQYLDDLDTLLSESKPGGFILFSNNISTYEETTNYIKSIKNSATIPMFIGIDQEGGLVQRIKQLPDANVITIPAMLELGKTGDVDLSYNVGKILATEIAAFGVNLDFAPVLDVFSNPNNTVIGNRAFGTDHETVEKMAIPFANGMQEAGVLPVFKHFPGHGDIDADSHVELPVVNKTKEELYQNELLPFKSAIDNGAQCIMIAHIALPNITGNYIPATLSKEIVTDLLRNELNYNGLVITDAINMGALANNYSLEEICNYSINAGVDCLLMPADPVETINTIERLVNDGTISEERINESVNRILTVKYRNKLDEEKTLDPSNIGKQENIDIVNRI